ncbi:hypothetical protein AC578_5729 [Pseudocercospora eumusae]|uniref:Granulins domain-containing protein n=1 Tax=Pseudocercospora eumusae TaxID=321146 RepID=A0A139HEZ2_9PEZI|nr:hypothetical protein AC578_5729 [Pseudocercospora eumusae]
MFSRAWVLLFGLVACVVAVADEEEVRAKTSWADRGAQPFGAVLLPRDVLERQYTCEAGYGLCENSGSCCPTNAGCCGQGCINKEVRAARRFCFFWTIIALTRSECVLLWIRRKAIPFAGYTS